MPRKKAHSNKKESAEVTTEQESAPRRSGRATKTDLSNKDEVERTRRSSTAAQTAASVAESRVTRSRNSVSSRRDSSPSENQKLAKEPGIESPASRVKSSRRTTGRINYKESDGEEEIATPKREEDNFVSSEDFEESDSDGKAKHKGKSKTPKVVTKGRSKGVTKAPKSRARGRGRPGKKKNEEKEAIDVSEDSSEHTDATLNMKKKRSSAAQEVKEDEEECIVTPSKSKSRQKNLPETEKVGRRSSRSSSKPQVVSKRPSRNKSVKKYTEDYDLSDEKSDEEVEYEPKVSRKRKRESVQEPNKKLKVDDTSDGTPVKNKATKDTSKADLESKVIEESIKTDSNLSSIEDKEEKQSEEEPMEIDETEAALPAGDIEKVSDEVLFKESVENDKSVAESCKEVVVDNKEKSQSTKVAHDDLQVADKELEKNTDSSFSPDFVESQPSSVTKPDIQEDVSDDKLVHSLEDSDKGDDNSNEFEDAPVSSADGDVSSLHSAESAEENAEICDETTSKTVHSSSVSDAQNNNTFYSKEQNSDYSMNGEKIESDISQSVTSNDFESKESTAPKENGAHEIDNSSKHFSDEQIYASRNREYVLNSSVSEDTRASLKNQIFSFVSYNLSNSVSQKDKLIHELNTLQGTIVALQGVSKICFDALELSLGTLGYNSVFSGPDGCPVGLATFYKSSMFKISRISEIPVVKLIEKELESSSFDSTVKSSVLSYMRNCGHMLLIHFVSCISEHEVVVANVQIPSCDTDIHVLQVSCLLHELSLAASKPLLLCGEFNMSENDISYQLLRTGYLNNEKFEELRSKICSSPEKENAAVVSLLQKSLQHPSYRLCSCYASTLGRELLVSEPKSTSPDLLWYSADCLHTLGVLNVTETKQEECHLSLKAEVAFSV